MSLSSSSTASNDDDDDEEEEEELLEDKDSTEDSGVCMIREQNLPMGDTSSTAQLIICHSYSLNA